MYAPFFKYFVSILHQCIYNSTFVLQNIVNIYETLLITINNCRYHYDNRTFANETSQFLAPYDQSVKSRTGAGVGDLSVGNECSPNHNHNHINNYNNSNNGGAGSTNTTGGGFSGVMSSNPSLSKPAISSQPSISHTELTNASAITKINKINCGVNRPTIAETVSACVEAWNPFEEQPFSQMMDEDDHSMEAEFDQIHQRGSHGSMLQIMYNLFNELNLTLVVLF